MDTPNKNRKTALTRSLVHIISRHSNWPATDINRTLSANVYAGRNAWRRFLDFFLLALGTGFTVAGIIFFFAYNWAEMHRFVKMGIVIVLLSGCVAIAVYAKIPHTAKGIILMGAALLVGALFAVYGQAYQTGADTWELFAVWTACIAVWTIVGNFAPLWLLFLILVNITIGLCWPYSSFDVTLLCAGIFTINAGFTAIGETLYVKGTLKHRPAWLFIIVSLYAVIFVTIEIIVGIFQYPDALFFSILLVLVTLAYTTSVVYSLRKHYTAYLLLVAGSVIAILAALLIKIIDEPIPATFVAGLFVIGSIALLVRLIYRLNKQWHGTR